jgi:hypothetical protein
VRSRLPRLNVSRFARSVVGIAVLSIATPWITAPRAGAATVNLYNNISGQPTTSGVSTEPVGPQGGQTFIVAKKFSPTTSGMANVISVWSQCVGIGCSEPGVIQIRPDNGGQPSATVLGSAGFTVPDSLGATPTCGLLSPGVALTTGTTYWAVMTSPDAIAWNFQNDSADVVKESTDGGSSWVNSPNPKQLSLRVDQGVGCAPAMVPNPVAGTPIAGMFIRSGSQTFNTITITNDGTSPLQLASGTVTGAGALVFSIQDSEPGPLARPFPFPTNLGLSATAIIYVTCTGVATEGNYQATFTMTTNDPTQPSISWPLTCIVVNTPPTIQVSVTPDGLNGWFVTKPAPVSFTAVPAVDGDLVKQLCGAPQSAVTDNITDEGTTTITCTATDIADNTSAPVSVTVKVDTRAPVVNPSLVPPPNAKGWNHTPVTVSFSCSDPTPGSGIATDTIGGGGTFSSDTPGIAVSSTGACTDVAGNVAAQGAATVRVDQTPPSTTITSAPPTRSSNTTASISFDGTDATSGVGSFQCSVDGAASTTCSSPLVLNGLADGLHTVHVAAVDNADNLDPTPATVSWTVDTSPPVVTIDSPASGAQTSHAGSITFHATDPDDTTFTFVCQLDTVSAPCSSPFTFSALGVGPHTFTVTAADAAGNMSTPATLPFTVVEPPAITSTNATTFTVGTPGSFAVTATGFPAPTFAKTGALPTGVIFDTMTGVLSGVPAAGTGGTYPLTITAHNGIGTDASQAFALTVDEAPAITSVASTTFTVGTSGTFMVGATGFPTPTLTESGALPGGVTFDTASGELSGTPDAGTGGVYPITFGASNGVGTDATQSFVLTVDQPPAITSGSSTGFTVGSPGSFTVTATGFPLPVLSESGPLPSGVTFDSTTGALSGTPDAGTGGVYPITLTATNGIGTDAMQSFTLSVGEAPAITSGSATIFTVGVSGSFTVTASGAPVPALAESGPLPSGVSFDTTTGVLSGRPDAGTGGVYPITFTASNGVSPEATQAFTLTVNEAPAITSNASTTFTAGKQGSFTASAVGFPAPTLTESGALPSGVMFDGSTGVLSGMPDAGTGGTYPITLTAANGIGADATQSFTLTVDETVAFSSTGSTTFTVGVAGNFTMTATGFPPPRFTESGALPSGVVFTAGTNGTATLAGTPAAGSGGAYTITITADNGVVDPSQQFSLTVNESSGFTGAASATFTVGKPGHAAITTSGFPKPTLTESGALPGGVIFDAATGTLSGTPAAGTAGTYALKITAHNGIGPDTSETFVLTVANAQIGYAMVDSDGHVSSFGSMSHPGDAPSGSVTGIARAADAKGYWIVNRSGQVFALGDARYRGGLAPHTLLRGKA